MRLRKVAQVVEDPQPEVEQDPWPQGEEPSEKFVELRPHDYDLPEVVEAEEPAPPPPSDERTPPKKVPSAVVAQVQKKEVAKRPLRLGRQEQAK